MNKLQRELIQCGKLLFDRRLISGWGGNLSCRIGENKFLITGQHAPLGFLATKDLVRVNGEGKPVNEIQRASSETPLHMAVYAGIDTQVVVHVHPPMVLAFSLSHDIFVPVSFEEKYTIGEIPIIAQSTPTVTRPEQLVEELKYRPVVIIKGHGTVATGKNLQEAFLFTDLLEEAVRCRFFTQRAARPSMEPAEFPVARQAMAATSTGPCYPLFSKEHMAALVESANADAQYRTHGEETRLSTSLTLFVTENKAAWTVHFDNGKITGLNPGDGGEFMISGEQQWWSAVFRARIDPFLATQQGKLKLERGELAQLSRWYKPFQRAFSIWQTIPIE